MLHLSKKTALVLVAIISVVSLCGCSMCCGPYDYHYPTYGGKHQRVDPVFGRVGSIFSDPLAGYNGAGADSNLDPAPEFEPRSDASEPESNSEMDSDNGETPEKLPALESVDSTAAKYRRFGL